MSEETKETAVGAAPQVETMTISKEDVGTLNISGLTTQSGEWALFARTLPNRDVAVPLKDYVFDQGQNTPATIERIERSQDEDGTHLVRITFNHEKPLQTIDKPAVTKAPGVWSPRFPFRLTGDKAEMDLRTLARIGQAAGVLDKKITPNTGQIVAAFDQLKGKQVHLKFGVKNSTKKDPETGQAIVNQTVSYAAPGEAANGSAKSEDY